MREDLAVWGAADEEIDAWIDARAAAGGLLFEVRPENAPVVELFVSLGTQWRVAPSGQALGLDYGSIPAVAEMLGLSLDRDLFLGVRVMERAALDAVKAG